MSLQGFRWTAVCSAMVCVPLFVFVVVGGSVQTGRPPDAQSARDFQPRRVVPPQRAIADPAVIPAARVRGQVTANELMLGVEIDGQARAYPINMLTGPRREIINDTLGGVPMAATW